MKTATLVHAKAHLSEIVDDAEHRGERTLIRRHGKPVAVVVPVAVGAPSKPRPRMTQEEIDAMRAEFSKYNVPGFSAVQDTIDGRR